MNVVEEMWEFFNKHGIAKIGNLKVDEFGYFSIEQGIENVDHVLYGRFKGFNLNILRINLDFALV